MRILQTMRNAAALVALAAILGACAFGRTYSYSDTPISLQGISSSGAVSVAVQDQRPYVISGNKSEHFVGLMRGGFGNPFDVNTSTGHPLAEDIGAALVRALKERGIDARAVAIQANDSMSAVKQRLGAARAHRAILLTLREWKTDTMMATDLHYDATLAVFDESGARLASSSIKGLDNLGSLGLSPDEGISRATARKLGQLFDDEKVAAALK